MKKLNKYESQSLKQKRTWKNTLSREIIMLRKTIMNILKETLKKNETVPKKFIFLKVLETHDKYENFNRK